MLNPHISTSRRQHWATLLSNKTTVNPAAVEAVSEPWFNTFSYSFEGLLYPNNTLWFIMYTYKGWFHPNATLTHYFLKADSTQT